MIMLSDSFTTAVATHFESFLFSTQVQNDLDLSLDIDCMLYSDLLGSSRTVYKLPTLSTLIQLIFSVKKLRIFYFKIAHLFIGIMLKTEIFYIYCMGKLLLGKLLLGKLVIGEIVVGEIGCWGNCCWGRCLGEVVLGI